MMLMLQITHVGSEHDVLYGVGRPLQVAQFYITENECKEKEHKVKQQPNDNINVALRFHTRPTTGKYLQENQPTQSLSCLRVRDSEKEIRRIMRCCLRQPDQRHAAKQVKKKNITKKKKEDKLNKVGMLILQITPEG